jgi:hypothetical protein
MAPSLSSPHTSHTIITLTEFVVLLDARRRSIGSVPQPIAALNQKYCVFNTECTLQTLVVGASVKKFAALMKQRGSLPYIVPGPYSQSLISFPKTTYFFKINVNINTHP